MEVRTATEADVPELLEMGRAMHAESPRYRHRHYSPDKVEQFARRLVATGGTHVAEIDGRIVGMFAGFVVEDWFGNDRVASDFVVYVRPEHRGSSAFVRLVKAFEKWAAGQGAVEIAPGVSTEVDPDKTVALYERLGYRALGARVLTKRLTDV